MKIDFFNIESLLSEEEILMRDTIRKFVDERIIPIISEHFENGTFPMHIVPELANLGLFGANLQEYGCAGLNNVAYGLIMQELERGDSGLRSFISVQSALTMYALYSFGSEEQKDKWLPAMARGEKFACFGLTEPDYGSNPLGMQTKAVKSGSSYILNGTKRWITNGSIADVAIIWAKLDGQIRGFLVEKGTPGLTVLEMKKKFSLRASITSELILEDCRIPEENILPKTDGLKSPLSCLTQARYGIAWGAIGAAMACYEEAINYARSRIQFDKPIASFQLVQEKLVFMITEITKAQLLSLQLGRLKDRGEMDHTQVSMAKMNNVHMALEIAREARDILGANGISLEYSAIRHMNNLETVKTYEGTESIHKLILGQRITGISAFS
jgi:glutaryl-CoA dehydrogenase